MTPLNGSSLLNQYLTDNSQLIRTMIIKSSVSADILNKNIQLIYGSSAVNLNDPTTWKYYLNLVGEYHPSLDTPMTITSLDTLGQILFSIDQLKIHTNTADAYGYGSRYYYSLISKYPAQEQLINNILYPGDTTMSFDDRIASAIAAEDGSIISYDHKLVEEQEITLISDLEAFIKRYLIRWDVPAFGVSDSLYPAAKWGVMYLNILPKLLNLRLARCKTYEAHSFHITQYLASHKYLDKYIPFMTLKQMLWLYRNIDYIERNAGKIGQFTKLIDHILTDRFIPLAAYSIRQLKTFDSKRYPNIIAKMQPMNSQYNVPEKDFIQIDTLYGKEEPLVYGNPRYYLADAAKDTLRFKNSASAVVQTKDLESAMIDYNDSMPDTIEEVLTREWVYMSCKGLYNSVINFHDPSTGEKASLFAKDAFMYMYYLSCMSVNIHVTSIPNFINLKSRRDPKPSLQDLLAVGDNRFTDLPEIAQIILNGQPQLTPCYSTSMFFNLAYVIYSQALQHWFIISDVQDHYKRAIVANMINMLYEDEYIVLDPDHTLMWKWLSDRGLPEYKYTYDQAQLVIANIFTSATGLTVDNSKMLKNIQKAMISMLQDLSSYSIQILTDINASSIIMTNWAAIRVGNIGNKCIAGEYIEDRIDVIKQTAISYDSRKFDLEASAVHDDYFHKHKYEVAVEAPVTVMSNVHTILPIEVNFNSFRLHAEYAAYDPAVSSIAPFIGMEYFYALTSDQQSQIKSIYNRE